MWFWSRRVDTCWHLLTSWCPDRLRSALWSRCWNLCSQDIVVSRSVGLGVVIKVSEPVSSSLVSSVRLNFCKIKLEQFWSKAIPTPTLPHSTETVRTSWVSTQNFHFLMSCFFTEQVTAGQYTLIRDQNWEGTNFRKQCSCTNNWFLSIMKDYIVVLKSWGCVSSFPTTLARCDRAILCIAGVCSRSEQNIAFLVMEWVIQDIAYPRRTLSCGVSYLTLLLRSGLHWGLV